MLAAVHRHLDAFVAAFLRVNAATVIQNYAVRHGGDEARVACRLLGVRELWRRVRWHRATRQRLPGMTG